MSKRERDPGLTLAPSSECRHKGSQGAAACGEEAARAGQGRGPDLAAHSGLPSPANCCSTGMPARELEAGVGRLG